MAVDDRGPAGAEHVEIVEVGPRDGLQNEAKVLSVDDRIAMIDRAADAGLRRIEAVSFVNPRRVPQMAGAEEIMKGVRRGPDVSHIGLVLNRRGLDRAVEAAVSEVNVAVPATDGFSVRNQGSTVDAMLDTLADIDRALEGTGIPLSVTVSTAFGCPFDGEVSTERVVEVVRRIADTSAVEIALADTIGVGVPGQVTELVGAVAAVVGGRALRCHFHNTRNTGYANAWAAAQAGVRVLDSSVGGFGGCPFAPAATGNIATEDLLYLLHRSGLHTGVSLSAAAALGDWTGARLDKEPPAYLGRAGDFPA
ncbi:hydroxymethylglutaryl-CoA lyase [Nocardiopsis flavescens]|uniref:Hydroxymethylglutaryl-CoA lyase n=1 Tax=Nocardiopsis flavescens TaxID=758803 RepID=A0A1M6HR29_9ACTN|nr:hydroxymethylglutaryl-CoA lyase [Nocardiopsis flavescens]SHJ24659.1 hydroxymethylglutaryl-CoA lyase [Nocardiopsis flavescens]